MVVPENYAGRPLPIRFGTLGCCGSSPDKGLNGAAPAALEYAVGGFAGLGVLLGGILLFTIGYNLFVGNHALDPYEGQRRRTKRRKR